ncbi:MAG: hypothetical protein ABL309_05720 [Phycisphaerales bacterium]
MNRDALIDLADDALDRLDRLQRWFERQSPHPVLSQMFLTIVVLSVALGSFAGSGETTRVAIGMSVCVAIGWACGVLGCVRSLGALRAQPQPTTDDDATVDLDPEALDSRRRLRLWSACFWWLQLPWLAAVFVGAVLRGIALMGGTPTSGVGMGCTLVPIWGVSIPTGMWLWQRHFRRMSRSMGSRTEEDLDPRVWWFGVLAMATSIVWAGVLILA